MASLLRSLLSNTDNNEKAQASKVKDLPVVVAPSGRVQTRGIKRADAAGVAKLLSNHVNPVKPVDVTKFEKTLRAFYDEDSSNFIAETCSNLWRPVVGLDNIIGWAFFHEYRSRPMYRGFGEVQLILPSLSNINAQLYQEIQDALLERIYERAKQVGEESISTELVFDDDSPQSVQQRDFLTAQGFEVVGRYRRVVKMADGRYQDLLTMQKHFESGTESAEGTSAPPEYSKEHEGSKSGQNP